MYYKYGRSTNTTTSSSGPSLRSKWRSEKPLANVAEILHESGVFCHVTHDKMAFSQVVSNVWQPCLFSSIGNRYLNKTTTFYRVFVTKF